MLQFVPLLQRAQLAGQEQPLSASMYTAQRSKLNHVMNNISRTSTVGCSLTLAPLAFRLDIGKAKTFQPMRGLRQACKDGLGQISAQDQLDQNSP